MSLDNLIDASVYQAVERATSKDFAFSYLAKAAQVGGVIYPFTVVAWERLTQNRPAMKAIAENRMEVRKPPAFSDDRAWPPSRRYGVAA